MSAPFLPYGQQWLDDDDIQAVVDVLRGDWLTTGPNVAHFEEQLAKTSQQDHAVAVNSGTAALHCAYYAAGVKEGDEVIVPSLTFSATANAARYLGATVRFADIDPTTLTMDPEHARSLVTARTKVIAPVDFAGHPADYDAFRALASDAGATLVADACHSIGGAYRGAPVGSLAHMSCFSFHPVKSITTGEGGAVVTNDEALAERARTFRTHGIERGVLGEDRDPGDWAYDIAELGYNYRITDFQCALGAAQLRHLEGWVARRQEIAAAYRLALADMDEITLPPDAEGSSHGYHLFVIRVPAQKRRTVFDKLRAAGIGVQVHYIPVNMLQAYRDLGYEPQETPHALEAYEQSISLPCFPKMSDSDIDRVADQLRSCLR